MESTTSTAAANTTFVIIHTFLVSCLFFFIPFLIFMFRQISFFGKEGVMLGWAITFLIENHELIIDVACI